MQGRQKVWPHWVKTGKIIIQRQIEQLNIYAGIIDYSSNLLQSIHMGFKHLFYLRCFINRCFNLCLSIDLLICCVFLNNFCLQASTIALLLALSYTIFDWCLVLTIYSQMRIKYIQTFNPNLIKLKSFLFIIFKHIATSLSLYFQKYPNRNYFKFSSPLLKLDLSENKTREYCIQIMCICALKAGI